MQYYEKDDIVVRSRDGVSLENYSPELGWVVYGMVAQHGEVLQPITEAEAVTQIAAFWEVSEAVVRSGL